MGWSVIEESDWRLVEACGGTICRCERGRCKAVAASELFFAERSTSIRQVFLRDCSWTTSCSGRHSILSGSFAYLLSRPLTSSSIWKQSWLTSPYLKSPKILPSCFHCSFSTNPHKALHPFMKSLLAITSALNFSTGSYGMATIRFFPTLTFTRSLWVLRLLLIWAMWNSSVPVGNHR